MRIAILKEVVPGERRVAIVPDTVKRLVAKQIEISVQAGAGTGANVTDEEYAAVGAKVETSLPALLASADLVIKVQVPTSTRSASSAKAAH